ncbi:MAG: hypothetical protein A2Z81_03405 [Omnitrophica WOR_2 bacterium GWA2_45_18]|nr:MAG: hypothetical protein A2Z81_03405 [Omnitrophica WOR_2 bacterium GWA2_45_18]
MTPSFRECSNGFYRFILFSIFIHLLIFKIGFLSQPAPIFAVREAPNSIEFEIVEAEHPPGKEQEIGNTKHFQQKVQGEEVFKSVVSSHYLQNAHTENNTTKTASVAQSIARRSSSKTVSSKSFQGALSVTKPVPIINPPPVYPKLARKLGWEGTVYLQVNVKKDGRASEVSVEKSSGHKILDDFALRVVRKWEFAAAHIGARKISSRVRIPVKFVLSEAP